MESGVCERGWLEWKDSDWKQWLEERLRERENVFAADPDELIGGYNRESQQERDYHGRELFELIQNADDAGYGYQGKKKILISLKENALFVANTGIPFSPEGIKSLMIGNNSPKQFLRTKCIGYKGLGFRAILGWASTITIISKGLSVDFNRKSAINWLKNIETRHPNISKKLSEYRKRVGVPYPIAILSIPFWLNRESIDSRNFSGLYSHAQEIIRGGYDTVICISFKESKKTRSQVEAQIKSLSKEILLFLNHLEEFNISYTKREETWRVERKKNKVTVCSQNKENVRWNIFASNGKIPRKYFSDASHPGERYEIKLAIPEKLEGMHRLYVYFPTKVSFPFPTLAHATFEVTSSRNELRINRINKFIAGKLADLIIRTAKGSRDGSNPWYALSTVARMDRGNQQSVLEELGFFEVLNNKIKKCPIIPVRGGFETSEKAKRIRANFNDLLIGRQFKNICFFTEDQSLDDLLNSLDIADIEYDDLRCRINNVVKKLTIEQKTEVICQMVNNSLLEEGKPSPELFIDEKGQRIRADNIVLFPPEGKFDFLPPWVTQKIIHPKQAKLLEEKLSSPLAALGPFNVHEYSCESLIKSVVSDADRRVKRDHRKEREIRQQMLKALWQLYQNDKDKGNFPEDVEVVLPTRTGKFNKALQLYFGKEYKSGKILEYLYCDVDNNLFVAAPKKLGFSDGETGVEEFLHWLKVNKEPGISDFEENISKGSYFDEALTSLKYPIKAENDVIQDEEDLRNRHEMQIEGCSIIHYLEEILEKADPLSIICWIAREERINNWIKDGDENARIGILRSKSKRKRYMEGQGVISYSLWLLRNTAWLPVLGGRKQKPSKCSFASVFKDEELASVIGYPVFDMKHPLIKELNFDQATIKNALNKIGIGVDLDDLSWDSFYEIMMELPKRDKDGKIARDVYRTLITKSDATLPSGKRYEKFMKAGKMFGVMGGKYEYFPISQLFYIDRSIVSESIASFFPIVALEKRRGAGKVERLFGIKKFDEEALKKKVSSKKEHSVADVFQKEFQKKKPYIYALRIDADVSRSELKVLKDVTIIPCEKLTVDIELNNESKEIVLSNGESHREGHDIYLVQGRIEDNIVDIMKNELVADAIGEIIANMLDVDISANVARVISCSVDKLEQLVNNITGGSGKEKIERSRGLLDIKADEEEPIFKVPMFHYEPPPEHIHDAEVDTDMQRDAHAQEKNNIGPLQDVLPILEDMVISIPQQVKPMRIQLNSRKVLSSMSSADPDRAEELSMKFEESQDRFPLSVSHIRGRGEDAYGCDIISFRSDSDRNTFQSGNEINIERFIEVKGRSSAKAGSIVLKGSQLEAARKRKERYFIYRVQEDREVKGFVLIELGDPLSCPEDNAVMQQYEVNPFYTKKSKKWKM